MTHAVPSSSTRPPFSAQCPFPCLIVAEDNLVNQKVLQRMLTRLGYSAKQIIVVDNGQKAVDAVVERVGGRTEGQDAEVGIENDGSSTSSLPLLVFMDVHMPVMNGLDATRAIRSHPAIPSSRQPYIVALTANAMSGDQETCLHHGMDDYLPKPVTVESISGATQKAHAVCLSRQRVSSS